MALNKSDAVGDLGEYLDWAEESGIEMHTISSVTGEGVSVLLYAIADEIERHVREAPDRSGFVLHRPLPAAFTVSRRGDEWVVSGRAAERAINVVIPGMVFGRRSD